VWTFNQGTSASRRGVTVSGLAEARLNRRSAMCPAADGTAMIWSLGSLYDWNRTDEENDEQPPRLLARCKGHEDSVNIVRWSPGGRFLATGGNDCKILLWERRSEMRPRVGMGQDASEEDHESWQAAAQLVGHGAEVQTLAWCPSGAVLASASFDRKIFVWSLATELPCSQADLESRALLPGVSAAQSRRISPLPTMREPSAVLQGHESIVRGLAWDPSGALLASIGDEDGVILWKRSSLNAPDPGWAGSAEGRSLEGAPAGIPSLFQDDSVALSTQPVSLLHDQPRAGGEEDETIRWESVDSSVDPFRNDLKAHVALRLSWSPDGQLLACPNGFSRPRFVAPVLKRQGLDPLVKLVGHSNPITVSMFARRSSESSPAWLFGTRPPKRARDASGAGKLTILLATGSSDGCVCVWSPERPRPLVVVPQAFTSPVSDATWAHSRSLLILSSMDGSVMALTLEQAGAAVGRNTPLEVELGRMEASLGRDAVAVPPSLRPASSFAWDAHAFSKELEILAPEWFRQSLRSQQEPLVGWDCSLPQHRPVLLDADKSAHSHPGRKHGSHSWPLESLADCSIHVLQPQEEATVEGRRRIRPERIVLGEPGEQLTAAELRQIVEGGSRWSASDKVAEVVVAPSPLRKSSALASSSQSQQNKATSVTTTATANNSSSSSSSGGGGGDGGGKSNGRKRVAPSLLVAGEGVAPPARARTVEAAAPRITTVVVTAPVREPAPPPQPPAAMPHASVAVPPSSIVVTPHAKLQGGSGGIDGTRRDVRAAMLVRGPASVSADWLCPWRGAEASGELASWVLGGGTQDPPAGGIRASWTGSRAAPAASMARRVTTVQATLPGKEEFAARLPGQVTALAGVASLEHSNMSLVLVGTAEGTLHVLGRGGQRIGPGLVVGSPVVGIACLPHATEGDHRDVVSVAVVGAGGRLELWDLACTRGGTVAVAGHEGADLRGLHSMLQRGASPMGFTWGGMSAVFPKPMQLVALSFTRERGDPLVLLTDPDSQGVAASWVREESSWRVFLGSHSRLSSMTASLCEGVGEAARASAEELEAGLLRPLLRSATDPAALLDALGDLEEMRFEAQSTRGEDAEWEWLRVYGSLASRAVDRGRVTELARELVHRSDSTHGAEARALLEQLCSAGPGSSRAAAESVL
jgi:WD40 repeat protein